MSNKRIVFAGIAVMTLACVFATQASAQIIYDFTTVVVPDAPPDEITVSDIPSGQNLLGKALPVQPQDGGTSVVFNTLSSPSFGSPLGISTSYNQMFGDYENVGVSEELINASFDPGSWPLPEAPRFWLDGTLTSSNAPSALTYSNATAGAIAGDTITVQTVIGGSTNSFTSLALSNYGGASGTIPLPPSLGLGALPLGSSLDNYLEIIGSTNGFALNSLTFSAIPEPSTFALFGFMTGVGVFIARRRRKAGSKS